MVVLENEAVTDEILHHDDATRPTPRPGGRAPGSPTVDVKSSQQQAQQEGSDLKRGSIGPPRVRYILWIRK